mmetsp:Transcript_12678/g.27997  ORF Transcript_12678/g.27997 Transcript_12678/m.27997 type:complete len:242 (-) Transcript_12678:414-1139(-)
MSRGHAVIALLRRQCVQMIQKDSKLDPTIARHVRIGGAPLPRLLHRVPQDRIPILLLQAQDPEGHSRFCAQAGADGHVVLPRTRVEVGQFILKPNFEVVRMNLVRIRPEEEVHCDGAVHTTREQHGHARKFAREFLLRGRCGIEIGTQQRPCLPLHRPNDILHPVHPSDGQHGTQPQILRYAFSIIHFHDIPCRKSFKEETHGRQKTGRQEGVRGSRYGEDVAGTQRCGHDHSGGASWHYF